MTQIPTTPITQPENANKTLEDILAPSAINVTPGYIQIGDNYMRTLFVATYPRYLNTNWFSPIINLDKTFDIAMYVHPQDTASILKKLRDQLGRLEAQIIENDAAGKIRDPVLETAVNDIEQLRDSLQQGTDKFFQFSLYITLYGASTKELDEHENAIRNVLESQLVYIKPATFRMREGFLSTLPLDEDQLDAHTSLNTAPISSTFPFCIL